SLRAERFSDRNWDLRIERWSDLTNAQFPAPNSYPKCLMGGLYDEKNTSGGTAVGSCTIPIKNFPDPKLDEPLTTSPMEKKAVFAGGCFWCVEAVFKELKGVLSVRSGYAGDTAETANYRTVCSGATNHAEAIKFAMTPVKPHSASCLRFTFPSRMIRHSSTGKGTISA